MSKTLFGFDIEQQWDYENGFYLTSHLTRIPKMLAHYELYKSCLLYTSPSPRDREKSRMPSSA